MRRSLTLLLALAFLAPSFVSSPETAFANASSNPTFHKNQIDFRRALPSNRYDFNKRAIERKIIENSLTSTGSTSTFDLRIHRFRDAYKVRLEQELQDRKFSGVSRQKTSAEERAEYLRQQQQRRINDRLEERRFGNQYLPGRARSINERDIPDVQEERRRQHQLRLQFKIKQGGLQRGYPRSCVGLSRSRFAKCLYDQQKEDGEDGED